MDRFAHHLAAEYSAALWEKYSRTQTATKKKILWTDESWATFEGHLVKNSTTNGPCARSGWQTTECHILAEKISPAVPLLFWN